MVNVALNKKGNVVVKGYTTSVVVFPADSLSAIESKLKKAYALAKKNNKVSSDEVKLLFVQAKGAAKKIKNQAENLGKTPVKEEKPKKTKKPAEKKKKEKKKKEKAKKPPPITFGEIEKPVPGEGAPPKEKIFGFAKLTSEAEKKYKKEEKAKKIVSETPVVKALEKAPPKPVPVKPVPKEEPKVSIPTVNWNKHLPSTLALIKQAKKQKPSKVSAEIKKFASSFWDLKGYVGKNRKSLTIQVFNEFLQLPEFRGFLISAACEDSNIGDMLVYLQKSKEKITQNTPSKYLQTANIVLGDYLARISAMHSGYKSETKHIGGIGKGKEMNANLLLSSLLYLRRWHLVNKKKLSGGQIPILMLGLQKAPPTAKKKPGFLMAK